MNTGDTPDLNYLLEGPGAAHIANVEQPERVTQLILTHLETK